MNARPSMASDRARSCQFTGVWVMGSASESRRRARGDDLAGLRAGVAESVGNGAREVVGVAGTEHPGLAADRELDAPAHDHAALLALVAQHVRASVGSGGV